MPCSAASRASKRISPVSLQALGAHGPGQDNARRRRTSAMKRSLAAHIRAANAALLVEGKSDAVGEFFASDYVVHLTGEDMTGGHAAIRRVLGMLQRAFRALEVEVEILVEGTERIAWQRTLRG